MFGAQKELPRLAAHRLLRYAIFLQGFDYNIIYKPTGAHGNADALSRIPMKTNTKEDSDANNGHDESSLCQLEQLNHVPVTHEKIRKETENDRELKEIIQNLIDGSDITNQEFKRLQGELTIGSGCLWRGSRIVVPKKLRNLILEELHSAHIGVTKMKMLARNYVWWPGIDKSIDNVASSCQQCVEYNKSPPRVVDHPWEEPVEPWVRIHIDYAGPFMNQYFFIVVDAFSKWLEVIPVKTISSSKTIDMLREQFARYGIPTTLVSDNAAYFTSKEFIDFMKSNNINARTIAPYHPKSNGQAERYVQTTKAALRKMATEGGDTNKKLCRFLLAYRRAPHATTGVSPSEMMMGRRIRSLLDSVKPVEKGLMPSKQLHSRQFKDGDLVMIRWYADRFSRWMKGRVVGRVGRVMYNIKTVDGTTVRRHVNQIKKLSPTWEVKD